MLLRADSWIIFCPLTLRRSQGNESYRAGELAPEVDRTLLSKDFCEAEGALRMFCPKCSQQQVSDSVRFCARCGFRLNAVKELLDQEEALATGAAQSKAASILPTQKDISIGAGLMFCGGIVAVVWGFIIGAGPLDAVLPQAFFILGFTLAFVLLFFHPLVGALHKLFGGEEPQPGQRAKQQNGINLGAILMFIGTLKAMLLTSLMRPEIRGVTTLLFMTGGFLMLLVIRWIVQAVYQLLFQRAGSAEEKASLPDAPERVTQLNPSSREAAYLPPAQSLPADSFIPPRSQTAEVVEPPSVTEKTTEILNNQ